MSHEAVRIQRLEEQVRTLSHAFENIKETHNYNVKRYVWIEDKCEQIQKEFDKLKTSDNSPEIT